MIYGIKTKDIRNHFSYDSGTVLPIQQPLIVGKSESEISDISNTDNDSYNDLYGGYKYFGNALKLGRNTNPLYSKDNVSVIIPSNDPINDIWVKAFNTPETNLTTTSGFTICMWAYFLDLQVTNLASSCMFNRQNVYDENSIVNTHSRVHMLVTASGIFLGGIVGRDSNSTSDPLIQTQTPASTIKTNRWYHLAFSYNGTFLNQTDFRNNNHINNQVRVYVDGVEYGNDIANNTTIPSNGIKDVISIAGQQSPNPPTVDVVNYSEFILGGNNLTRRSKGTSQVVVEGQLKGIMNGYLRNVAVFDRKLTANEIAQIYGANGNPNGIANLVMHLPLQENDIFRSDNRYYISGLLPIGAKPQIEWLEKYIGNPIPPNPLLKYEVYANSRLFNNIKTFKPKIKSGLKIKYDGATNLNAVLMPTTLPTNAFSIAFKFSMNDVSLVSGKKGLMFAFGDSLDSSNLSRNNLYCEYVKDSLDANAGKLRIVCTNNGAETSLVSTNSIDSLDVLYTFAIVYDGAYLKLYSNGYLDNSILASLPNYNSIATKYHSISKASSFPSNMSIDIDFDIYQYYLSTSVLVEYELMNLSNVGYSNSTRPFINAMSDRKAYKDVIVESQFQQGSFSDIGGLHLETNNGLNLNVEGYSDIYDIHNKIVNINSLK